MKEMVENKKGITLIALVITVIIIIILAGISLNIIWGQDGIMTRAKSAQKTQDIARLYEKLEIEKGEVAIENDYTATLKQYIEQIKKDNIVTPEDKNNCIIDEENVDLGSCYIRVEEKYYFKIEQDEENEGNVKITYVEDPTILKFKETVTTNSIKVEVTAVGVREYAYYIKTEEGERIKDGSSKDGNHTYENLTQNTRYYVEIILIGEDGKQEKIEKWIVTKGIDKLTSANTTFTYEPNGWTKEDVVATASTTVKGYTLQTSKDGINWENTASQTYQRNGTIYARLVDSTGQEGEGTAGNIDKIDKQNPKDAEIVVSGEETQANLPIKLTITVTHQDELSGVQIEACKYVLNNISTSIGTNEESYTGGRFSTNGQELPIEITEEKEWYLHVLTVDNVGNPKETISNPITVEANRHEHTTSCYGSVTCTVSSTQIDSYRLGGHPCSSCKVTNTEDRKKYKVTHSLCGAVGYYETYTCTQCWTKNTISSSGLTSNHTISNYLTCKKPEIDGYKVIY